MLEIKKREKKEFIIPCTKTGAERYNAYMAKCKRKNLTSSEAIRGLVDFWLNEPEEDDVLNGLPTEEGE